jgi:hypothetical protein
MTTWVSRPPIPLDPSNFSSPLTGPRDCLCLGFLDDDGARRDHRNPPIHHCRRSVRFADIRRSTTEYHSRRPVCGRIPGAAVKQSP